MLLYIMLLRMDIFSEYLPTHPSPSSHLPPLLNVPRAVVYRNKSVVMATIYIYCPARHWKWVAGVTCHAKGPSTLTAVWVVGTWPFGILQLSACGFHQRTRLVWQTPGVVMGTETRHGNRRRYTIHCGAIVREREIHSSMVILSSSSIIDSVQTCHTHTHEPGC